MRNIFGRGRKNDETRENREPERSSEATTKDELYATTGSTGFKVIADPTGADFDIVFIHGLTGDRELTWKHKNGVLWPEELRQDIQTARIMTFGYDADVVKLWGTVGDNNIRNHGKNLAHGLSDLRRGCRDRGIIFIAHSLGGLVCEEALLISLEGEEVYKKIFRSTLGIIFMGTPHGGADLAKYGHALAKYFDVVRHANHTILDVLRQKSEVLIQVQQRFQQCLQQPDVRIKVYCFFEEKPVLGVGKIVDEHSAALSQYPNQSIAADHMDMTKFSGRADDGYQKVMNRIIDFTESAEQAYLEIDSEREIEVLQLLRSSGCEYERFKNRNKSPVKGTCQWFLKQEIYTSWRDRTSASLLWVSANPGCGKSVLARYLADDVLPATDRRTICSFFFKDDNDDQKSVTKALCALLHQLFSQNKGLLKHAKKVLDDNGERFTLNFELLWGLLVTASKDPATREMICVLDALDECKSSGLDLLLGKICELYEDGSRTHADPKLKFLVTSRPLQSIKDRFIELIQDLPTIHLAGEEKTDEIRDEINLVIEAELCKIQLKWKPTQKMMDQLRADIVRVEHRTYLWVMLIFDLVKKDAQSMSKRGRRKIFDTIPVSVNEAYEAILNQSTDKAQALKLLQIVCVAKRPLEVKEMFIALTIEEDDKKLDDLDDTSEEHAKSLIRNLCGLFVTVIDGRVYLLHQTAREFLLRGSERTSLTNTSAGMWKGSISLTDSHYVIAHACVWYLLLEGLALRRSAGYTRDEEMESPNSNLAESPRSSIYSLDSSFEDNEGIESYGILKYAAMYWGEHFREALIPEGHPAVDLAVSLCSSSNDSFKVWTGTNRVGRFRRLPETDGLHLASWLGHQSVVAKHIQMRRFDVNQADRNYDTPLHYAVMEGHANVVHQLLMVPGIDINKADRVGETPLGYAASEGHVDIIAQLLMVPGIDVNKANEDGKTPLCYAASWGYADIIARLLMVPGIDVNKADQYGKTPLCYAASRGYADIIARLLMVPGIDVNKADQYGKTPLYCAASQGYADITAQLLKIPGIDVNKANQYGETPLGYAASEGHVDIIAQLLMVPGIDVSKANEDGKTPLCYAASWGHVAIIAQLLRVQGIDVNKVDKYGQTPLYHAAFRGHVDIIAQLLAMPGIDVNKADEDGWTPLYCAAYWRHVDIIAQLLTVPGIDVNKADQDGETPLFCATSRGHADIATQLVAAPGIDPRDVARCSNLKVESESLSSS